MAVTVAEMQRRTGEAINRGIFKTQNHLEEKFPHGNEPLTAYHLMKVFTVLGKNIKDELNSISQT
jgi:hypothetical protein